MESRGAGDYSRLLADLRRRRALNNVEDGLNVPCEHQHANQSVVSKVHHFKFHLLVVQIRLVLYTVYGKDCNHADLLPKLCLHLPVL
jgi:hypothetical protein